MNQQNGAGNQKIPRTFVRILFPFRQALRFTKRQGNPADVPEQRFARLITTSRVNELVTLNTSPGFPSFSAGRT